MLRNYFITAFRYIIRNKIQSFIQVLSLTIGITAIILIANYAKYELSYDRFNEKFDRIYRLEYDDQAAQPTAPGHLIKQEIPEVENVVRMGWPSEWIVTYTPENDAAGKRQVKIDNCHLVDSTIFEVFTFNFIQGNPKTALRDPNSCVLTQSTARKIFGDRDPVGKRLHQLGADNMGEAAITGIIEDVKHSHVKIDMMTSYTTLEHEYRTPRGEPGYLNQWWVHRAINTYLLLPESNDPSYVERRLKDFFTEKLKSEKYISLDGDKFSLRPLRDIYFTTDLRFDYGGYSLKLGNLKRLRVLMSIALLLLILGIINYVNLATARASLRAREIGIRKVVGTSKTRLIVQFLAETILITLFSLLIALTLVLILLPGFNELAPADMELKYIFNPGAWMIYLIFVFILGVISGIYPAVYMTGFQPVESLSGGSSKGTGPVLFRRILFTFQFTISIALIIGVLVILRQLYYMKSADLGFNKELIVKLECPGDEEGWWIDPLKRQLLMEQLLKNPNISDVAFSSLVMGDVKDYADWMGNLSGIEKQPMNLKIDPNFLDVMGIKLVVGRNFSWDRTGDYLPSSSPPFKFIINETAVREFRLEEPVGSFLEHESGTKLEIIGVIRDFHYRSQHEKIEPCLFFWTNLLACANIKIAATDIPATFRYIQKEAQSLYPDGNIIVSFLDETYDRQYLKDEKNARLISSFAIVAVLIACLGLFGLSSFMAARRTKEIGIRKTMGASVRTVFLLLSREFVKWVVLSVVIACPIAWISMNQWLQSFAYRTNIPWWIFALTILIAFAIAFLTVAWQSLKMARTNPVEALRYE